MIQEGFQAQMKMILDKLSDAEDKLCGSSRYTQREVQQTKINKKTPSNGSMFKLANLNDKVKVEVDDELWVKAANPLPKKIQAVTDSSEECKYEQFSRNSTNGERDSVESESTPVVQFHQTQQSFLQAQANFQHVLPNDTTDGHPLMSKSPLKEARKQDEDCILIYESRTSIADQETANRLFLPSNFYNYTKREPCPGCIGCRGIPEKSINFMKNEEKENKAGSTIALVSKGVLKPVTSKAASHEFEKPTFEAQENSAFSLSQMTVSQEPFQGEDNHLFAEPAEEAKEQDEPFIPLHEEIQVVTGEEGLEVMSSERAKLSRFDVAPKPSSSTLSESQIITTPAKPVQILSSKVEKSTSVHFPTHVTGRRILTAKRRLKGSNKRQDGDCILVYEVCSQLADREKAHRLCLPLNFFNYTKHESCPGCIGCRGIAKRAAGTIKQEVKDIKQVAVRDYFENLYGTW